MACLLTTVDRYVQERKQLGEFRPTTARVNRFVLRNFAEHAGPKMAIGRLDRRHVENWLRDLRCADSTRYSRLTVVRAFTRWCVDHRLVRTDPCVGLKGPRRPQSLPRAVSPDAVHSVVSVCDDRLAVCVLLGAQEGLRRAEITSLSTSDVDLEQRLLRVRGKGQKERWVPLSEETAIALERYLGEYPAGPHLPLIRSYLEPTRGVTPDRIGLLVSAAMRIAGVKHAAWDGKSVHALRHTCANDMLDHGAEIRDVQEMLGHAHLATTTIYLRRALAVSRLRDAASGRQYVR